jgi:diacylglycerol O-acyltransferase / wax synthase
MVKRLSALDAAFLHLETPEMPMHVGALHIFELPAGFKGRFVDALRRHMAERLPLAPALRRRLWFMPMNLTNPVWVDAEMDMQRHVVEVKLPATRGKGPRNELAALERLVGKLHVQLIDRKHPLWKFHAIEGLAPGPEGRQRVAMYTQLHHAAVDGQAAVALANAILDLSADPPPREIHASTREKRFKLSMAEMLSGAIRGEVAQVAKLIRSLPETAGSISAAAGRMAARSEIVSGRKRAGSLGLAPRMALNGPVTAGRAFAALTLPLPELKALGKSHGATLNDVVLWLVSSAMREFYLAKGELPRKSLVAAVPVSLRAKGDTSSDNQASMTLMSLSTNVADARKRLHAIMAAGKSMKATLSKVKSVLPTDFPSLGMSWLTEAAGSVMRRATGSERIPALANVTVSNVPGPPVPLYLAGARMLTNYPCSIVTHGIGLNITVQTYDQSYDFGLMADAKAMPDVRKLADAIAAAFEQLKTLPLHDDDAAPPRKPVPAVKKVAPRPAKPKTTSRN